MTSGLRSRAAATNGSDGSIAETAVAPTRLTSSAVSAPGPQPTSSTRAPGAISAKSASNGASGTENLPMKRSYASAATAKLIRGRYVEIGDEADAELVALRIAQHVVVVVRIAR